MNFKATTNTKEDKDHEDKGMMNLGFEVVQTHKGMTS
jgi:hypothetical protein